MEFKILGPVAVLDDGGEPVPLGGPKQRALLAFLLLHPNETVSVDRLMDALWGDEPPETARNTIQVYVSQLRKIIRAAGAPAEALVTQAPGYHLSVVGEILDLTLFERLTQEGREALSVGQPGIASVRLRDALSVWRGEPLTDFSYEPFAQIEIERLRELRMTALEDRIEADLESGHDTGLVGELESFARMYPHRERIQGHLMLALYRAGRQEEALDVFRAAAARVNDELGIDPGPELRRLQEAILRQEEWLEAPERAPGGRVESEVGISEPAHAREMHLAEGEMTSVVVAAVSMDEPGRLGDVLSADQMGAVLEELGARLRRPFEEAGAQTVPTDNGFIAICGLPIANDHDAQRASSAALSAARAGALYAHEVGQNWGARAPGARIGLAAGRMAGKEFAVDDKQVAAPLEAAAALSARAAPGTVVLGPSVASRLGHGFVIRTLGDGDDRQLLLGVQPRHAPAGPFVDREDELGRARLALDDMRAGRGRLLLLEGEAGIGKSRLIAELRQDARDALWLEGDCSTGEAGWPLQPFVEMLRSWLGVTSESDVAMVRRRMATGLRTLGLDDDPLSRVLESLLAVPEDHPPSDAEAIRGAITGWLRAIADSGPLVVVFEDAHASDTLTASILEATLGVIDVAPLLMVITTRSGDQGQVGQVRMAALANFAHRTDHLRIGPLSDLDAGVLADALSPTGALEADTRDHLVSRAGGNPLYLEGLMSSLTETGALEKGGRWTLSMTTMGALLPPALESLLVARIHRLPEHSRRLAQIAAAVGRQFSLPLLERALGQGVDDDLPALLRAELIIEVGRVPEPMCAFAHPLVREAALATLTPAKAKEIYGSVARAAEELWRDSTDERSEQLGFYFYRSDEPARAVAYLELAAERAESLSDRDRAGDLRARAARAASRA